jgi:hypothetical protein
MQSATLKRKLKDHIEISEEFRIRIHRAISWLGCAEEQSTEDNKDIFHKEINLRYWIDPFSMIIYSPLVPKQSIN